MGRLSMTGDVAGKDNAVSGYINYTIYYSYGTCGSVCVWGRDPKYVIFGDYFHFLLDVVSFEKYVRVESIW